MTVSTLYARLPQYLCAVALTLIYLPTIAVELEGTPVPVDPSSVVEAQINSETLTRPSIGANQNPEWLNEHNAQMQELEEGGSEKNVLLSPSSDENQSPDWANEHNAQMQELEGQQQRDHAGTTEQHMRQKNWQDELEKNLSQAFSNENKNQHNEHHGFPGLVALIAIFGMFTAIAILCSPLILIGFYLTLRYKARARHQRELNANIDKLLAAGRDIPVEILRGDDPKRADDQGSMAKGIRNICLGTGWFVFLVIAFGIGVAALGFIWIALGVSQVLIWHLNKPAEAVATEPQAGHQG